MDISQINTQKLIDNCQKFKIDFLGVFGSYSRGDTHSGSDLDLLVRFSPDAKISYFKLYNIEQAFKDDLNIPIDLVTVDELSPYIKDRVMQNLKVIYGQP